jgi:4-hydroxy-3-methylbut-2-enyl diphosphate reductase
MDPWPVADSQNPSCVLVTSGASCPDATVDRVMHAILNRYPGSKDVDEVLVDFEQRMTV